MCVGWHVFFGVGVGWLLGVCVLAGWCYCCVLVDWCVCWLVLICVGWCWLFGWLVCVCWLVMMCVGWRVLVGVGVRWLVGVCWLVGVDVC